MATAAYDLTYISVSFKEKLPWPIYWSLHGSTDTSVCEARARIYGVFVAEITKHTEKRRRKKKRNWTIYPRVHYVHTTHTPNIDTVNYIRARAQTVHAFICFTPWCKHLCKIYEFVEYQTRALNSPRKPRSSSTAFRSRVDRRGQEDKQSNGHGWIHIYEKKKKRSWKRHFRISYERKKRSCTINYIVFENAEEQ